MKVLMFGAGGHSVEVADAIQAMGHSVVGVYDDFAKGLHSTLGIPISGVTNGVEADCSVFAVGDNMLRSRWLDEFAEYFPPLEVVHPTATISASSRLGNAVQVLVRATIQGGAVIGDNAILNTGCIISHHCSVGANTHIAPGVILGGEAAIGRGCFIGAGAIVLPGIRVGDSAVVGAGAVVSSDVLESDVVAGVPARSLRKED